MQPYERVAAALRRSITSGAWPPGYRLPSWRQLAVQHDVGQGAIRLAIQQLRAEGLVEGVQRARLTVAYSPAVRTLTDPDADWPYGRGDAEHSTVRAGDDLALRLKVQPRAVLQRERVELLDPDGRPAMLVTAWRKGALRPHADRRCTLRAHVLERAEAALLGLAPGIPALLIARTRLDAAGRPVQTADLVLPADRWRVAF